MSSIVGRVLESMRVEKLIEKMPMRYKFYFWDGSFMGITEDGIKWLIERREK